MGNSQPILEGLRVLDTTSGIAGPYCSKILADAGADVVKVEEPPGDALRREGSGALFEYLNARKRSVVHDEALRAGADILVTQDPGDVGSFREANPGLITLSITPFGRSGPWVGKPWTEFTLQAACGSIGQRGVPDGPPIAAGGRMGEWAAGTYAAVAALAAVCYRRSSGIPADIDLAVFDCMAITMVTYPSVFASFMGWPPMRGTGRTIQIPSVEPTKDGCFVITANSAQQFRDFLLMIERPDLIDDSDLAQVAKRFARRKEFLAAVRAHTSRKSTSEVLDEAALFRIPAAPVLDPPGVLSFEHFDVRNVFERSASGRFVQPRVPYRIPGLPPPPLETAPTCGEHEHETWPDSSDARSSTRRGPDSPLPLSGIRVVDCTAWWAGPSATNLLAALGADVIKIESASHPDPMRLTSVRRPPADQWWEWGPIFHAVNHGKRALSLDLGSTEGLSVFRKLLSTADVLVENFTPRVMEQFGLGWDSVHELNKSLIMIRMPAFGLDGPWRDRTGFAQTMEAVSGLTWRTGFPDELPTLILGTCDPIAGLHATAAALLGLLRRDDTGEGLLVESVMVESALNVAAEALVEYSASGSVMRREGNRNLGCAPQGVYPCAGEDSWIAIAVETNDQWKAVSSTIGWTDGPHNAALQDRRASHDAIDARLSAWTSIHSAEEVAELFQSLGVPAEVVIAARDVLRNPQLQHRGLFELEDHPVTGEHQIPTVPFRFSGIQHWLRSPSPTLGQDNDDVLGELGLTVSEIDDLRSSGVVSEGLLGS